MSQTKTDKKFHKLTVRMRDGMTGTTAGISTGGNTEVLLDGQPLKGIKYLKCEFKPAKVTKIVLELVGEVDIEGEYTLGRYSPTLPTLKVSYPSDKSEDIFKALKEGGLVIADRGAGKTRALGRILMEEPNSVVITNFFEQKKTLVKYVPLAQKRIFLASEDSLEAKTSQYKKIYIDEYKPGDQHVRSFYAATASVGISVIK